MDSIFDPTGFVFRWYRYLLRGIDNGMGATKPLRVFVTVSRHACNPWVAYRFGALERRSLPAGFRFNKQIPAARERRYSKLRNSLPLEVYHGANGV